MGVRGSDVKGGGFTPTEPVFIRTNASFILSFTLALDKIDEVNKIVSYEHLNKSCDNCYLLMSIYKHLKIN